MAWGGIAHDRVNDLLIMPVNNLAAEVRLIPRDRRRRANARRAGSAATSSTRRSRARPYALVRRLLLGPKTQLPCTPPPWGTLAAVKAATGEIAWQVPLGQFPGTEKMPDAAAVGIDRARRSDRDGWRTGVHGRHARSRDLRLRRPDRQTTVEGHAAHERTVDADDVSRPRRPAIRRHLRGRPWSCRSARRSGTTSWRLHSQRIRRALTDGTLETP